MTPGTLEDVPRRPHALMARSRAGVQCSPWGPLTFRVAKRPHLSSGLTPLPKDVTATVHTGLPVTPGVR